MFWTVLLNIFINILKKYLKNVSLNRIINILLFNLKAELKIKPLFGICKWHLYKILLHFRKNIISTKTDDQFNLELGLLFFRCDIDRLRFSLFWVKDPCMESPYILCNPPPTSASPTATVWRRCRLVVWRRRRFQSDTIPGCNWKYS